LKTLNTSHRNASDLNSVRRNLLKTDMSRLA
jgi:hypothetical protein